MASPVQLSGGSFQDSQGNPLANGYLKFLLSQDGTVPGSGNISSGIEITITLDANGNVNGGQSIWGNDVIVPVNGTFYRVTGYTAKGQPAWGPNNQQVTGATFNLSSWVPNQLIQLTNQVAPITLEHNGALNASQTLLNLVNSPSVTWSDLGGGQIQAAAALPTPMRQAQIYALGDSSTTNPVVQGMPTGIQTSSVFTATASPAGTVAGFGAFDSFFGAPNGTVNTDMWWKFGYDASISTLNTLTLACVQRFQFTQRYKSVASVRYWLGVTTANIGSNTAFATDTPNAAFVAFRFNSSTANWHAVAGTSNVAFTDVDTGVAFTANPTQFAIVMSSSGTVATFFINGVSVATISTNLPGANSTLAAFSTADNKNVANEPQIDFFHSEIVFAT